MRDFEAPRVDWFALEVASGAEFSIAKSLEARGLTVWAPKYQEARRKHRRQSYKGRRIVDYPILRGFVFVGGEVHPSTPFGWGAAVIDWPAAFAFAKVFGVLSLSGAPAPIRGEEIERMERAAQGRSFGAKPIEAGAETGAFEIGEAVRVVEGPFTGIETVVVDMGRSLGGDRWARLVVSVLGADREINFPVDHVISSQ